jgi:ubiquinone/menaquinone biosynthesis C-methylase UbiE
MDYSTRRISENLRDHYEKVLSQHGPTPLGVDWSENTEEYADRIQRLFDAANVREGDSVLDAGCGYGGMLEWCRHTGKNVDYFGIDISSSMILAAKKKFPGDSARFAVSDLLEYKPGPASVDWVLINGVFSQLLGGTRRDRDTFLSESLSSLIRIARKGVAFNVMSTFVNWQADNLYYRNPAELLAWIQLTFGSRVRIDHSFSDYEYVVCILKELSGA